MYSKVSGLKGCVVPALAASVWLATVAAQAGPGDKIQYSAPSNPTVASNLNSLNPSSYQSTFKQVEEDLFKPFKPGISYKREDLGVPPGMTIYYMPDKRTLEMIERRRNWAFANWDDMFPDPTKQDPSDDLLGGKGKKPVSLIEKYYESLDQKRLAPTNRLDTTGRFKQDFAGTNAWDPDGETFTPEGQFNKLMKQVFNPSVGDGDKSVVDFRNQVIRPPTVEEIKDQKRRFEEFQKLLDPHAAQTPADQSGIATQAHTAGYNSANQFDPTSSHRSSFALPGGATDPTAKAFYSHVYDDPTALALGQTNNLLTPRPNPPPTVAPDQPFDNIPKRKF